MASAAQRPTADDLVALLHDFDWARWNTELRADFLQLFRDVVVSRADQITARSDTVFDVKDPFTSQYMTDYVGSRIVQLDETTKAEVTTLLRDALAGTEGLTPFQLGTKIAQLVQAKFSDYARYRADRIARTETAFAFNIGTLLGAMQAGFTDVDVSDGVEFDDECLAADGAVWPIAYALDHLLSHPNCRRAFSPRPKTAAAAA